MRFCVFQEHVFPTTCSSLPAFISHSVTIAALSVSAVRLPGREPQNHSPGLGDWRNCKGHSLARDLRFSSTGYPSQVLRPFESTPAVGHIAKVVASDHTRIGIPRNVRVRATRQLASSIRVTANWRKRKNGYSTMPEMQRIPSRSRLRSRRKR